MEPALQNLLKLLARIAVEKYLDELRVPTIESAEAREPSTSNLQIAVANPNGEKNDKS